MLVQKSGTKAEQKDLKLLRSSCTLTEILEAMRNPNTGLCYLTQPNKGGGCGVLPPTSFVSGEAVLWLMEHVEGVWGEREAVSVGQRMLDKNMIRHASGDPRHEFIYGFYLYYLVPADLKDPNMNQYHGSVEAFQHDWIEVGLEYFRSGQESPQESPQPYENNSGFGLDFLQQNIRRCSGSAKDLKKSGRVGEGEFSFKSFTLDPDIGGKSDRSEWGEGKYQATYRPDRAFELRVNWSVGTGALVAELVSNWARKAQSNGLSIIPIPGDPFALPSQNSDPIRGPIFIKLDTDSLKEGGNSHLFEQFSEDSWEQRLFPFRESIVKRFGFIACTTEPTQQKSSATFSTHHQYIHCTGNCFVLIPTQLHLLPGVLGMRQAKRSVTNILDKVATKESLGQGKDKISRHPPGLGVQVSYSHDETGFLWSWNFMVSKRWKNMASTGATGDISFMDKLLADFRRFCNNEDNRLVTYWEECLLSMEQEQAGDSGG